jgi:hypothetical protein
MNVSHTNARVAVRLMLALVMMLVATRGFAAASLSPEAMDVLHSAHTAVLYSLEPWTDPDDIKAKAKQLDGYAILGKASMSRSQTLAAVSEIEKAMAAWEEGPVAACFDPRHALRVRSKGHVYDFLVCYECEGIQVFKDGALIASAYVRGSPRVFNAMLRDANVPVSTTGSR